jgi:teichuronic acid biosynthesis glycosyltransferase TuaG
MTDVLVTIVIPAYRAEAYLRQSLESALRQEISCEILIIDDCSPDETGALADGLRAEHPEEIKVIHNQQNLGVAESRNIAIRMARGRYIALLDADDWWADGKLKKQVALLETTGCALCCTGRELMNPDGSSLQKTIGVPARISYQMILKTNLISCSSVLMRTEVAQEFEMTHDELHEDYILWLKILKKYGDACGIDAPLLKSRLSDGGKSRNKLKSAKMQFGVYRLMGFGLLRSCFYFIQYAVNGFRKYH